MKWSDLSTARKWLVSGAGTFVAVAADIATLGDGLETADEMIYTPTEAKEEVQQMHNEDMQVVLEKIDLALELEAKRSIRECEADKQGRIERHDRTMARIRSQIIAGDYKNEAHKDLLAQDLARFQAKVDEIEKKECK